MSKHSLLLKKVSAQNAPFSTSASDVKPAPQEVATSVTHAGVYLFLIQRLFQTPAVVSILSGVTSSPSPNVCQDLAAELAGFGKRVLIVPDSTLAAIEPGTVPDESAFSQGKLPSIYVWSSPTKYKIDFYKPRTEPGNWMVSLRRNFDAVLLDWNGATAGRNTNEFLTQSDAAVLVVEAGISKTLLAQEQQALLVKGAKLAGSILIQRR